MFNSGIQFIDCIYSIQEQKYSSGVSVDAVRDITVNIPVKVSDTNVISTPNQGESALETTALHLHHPTKYSEE